MLFRSKADIIEEIKAKDIPDINGYDYLLNMNISSFSNERINALITEIAQVESNRDLLLSKDEKALWLDDVQRVEEAFDLYLNDLALRQNITTTKRTKEQHHQRKKKAKAR